MLKYPRTWRLVAGSAYSWTGTWYSMTDSNGDPSSPVNLTGYSARCQGRTAAGTTPASWDVDDDTLGGVTLGGVAGTVTVELTAAQTDALAGSRGVWAILLTDPSGNPVEWLRGDWVCDDEIVYDDPEE